MSTLEQIKENIELFSKPDAVPGCLSEEEKALLVKVKAIYDSIVTIPCTDCEYCMPCPHGVNIPLVFSLYNDVFRFERLEQSKRKYWFISKDEGADRCEACGECESKCPQSIEIIDRLKVVRQELEGWIE